MRASIATLLLAAAMLAAVSDASAQSRCRVMDPTGTPLNVRTGPGGAVVSNLPNGFLVSIVDIARDNRGRPWALVARHDNGRHLGWVWREFLACF